MSGKQSRAGGKFSGTHTTLIPAAGMVADIAAGSSAVSRISPGFVKAGLRSARGKRRVKITDDGSRILLKVRDNTSHQELHIYTTDIEAAKKAIADGARKKGFSVSFDKGAGRGG